ncbi:MAG: ATP-binding protein [Bryobacteraceae bacterium]
MNPDGSVPGTSTHPGTGRQPYLVSLAVLLVSLAVTASLWWQAFDRSRRMESARLQQRFTQMAALLEDRLERVSALHGAMRSFVRDGPLPSGAWPRYAAAIESRNIPGLDGFGVIDGAGAQVYWFSSAGSSGGGFSIAPLPQDRWLVSTTPAADRWRVATAVRIEALMAGLDPGSSGCRLHLNCGQDTGGHEPEGKAANGLPSGQFERSLPAPAQGQFCRLAASFPGPPSAEGSTILEGGLALSLTLAMLVFWLTRERDLAARRAVLNHAALRKSETDARNLISIANRSDNGFLILDGEGRVLWANDVVCRRSGYTRAQLSGRDPFFLLQGKGADIAHAEEARRSVLAGLPVRFEAKAFDQAGEGYWLEVDLQPIPAGAARLECVLGISRPLRADREMRDAALRTRRAIESVSEGIAIWDRQGRYVYHNPAFEQQFGYTVDECRSLGGPEALFVDAAALTALGHGAAGACIEAAMRRRQGGVREMRITISTIHNEMDAPIGRVSVFTDISDAKRVERQLRDARDSALAASAAKSAFLANVSHELRTPLNGVTGMVNLLLTTELDAEQREYARLAHLSGTLLLRVINDILDLSKLEAGRLQLECVPFDARLLLEECGAVEAVTARHKGLVFDVRVDAGLTAMRKGDPTRVRQVVANLLSNAIKFTERGCVRLDAREHAGLLRIEVADSGIGIPAGAIETIFEPFTQADSTTTRRFGGTGLGLAICKQLVGMMNGTIGVSSQPGMGSTFTVDLPLEAVEQEKGSLQLVS